MCVYERERELEQNREREREREIERGVGGNLMRKNQIGMEEIAKNSSGGRLRLLIQKRTERYKSLVKKKREKAKSR